MCTYSTYEQGSSCFAFGHLSDDIYLFVGNNINTNKSSLAKAVIYSQAMLNSPRTFCFGFMHCRFQAEMEIEDQRQLLETLL